MNLLFVTHHRRFKTVARSAPLARQLARRGHQVTVVCIADNARWSFRESVEHGVRYLETPDLLWGRLRSGWDPLSVVRRRLRLRDADYDLVHAFESRPATIHPVLALLRRRPAPLVMDWVDWWGRGGLIAEQRPRWYQLAFGGIETWYEEHFRTRADATTVISRALGDRAEALGVPRERIFLIPDGAEPDVFVPQDPQRHREAFGLPPDAFILGFSALDVTLDTELVLRALQHVLRTHPHALLIMTGHQPAGLEAMVARAGVGGRFRHLGFLPYARLPDALACVDLFLLPFRDKVANRGRWPHKIGDYMSMGKATVTNPVGEMKLLMEREAIGVTAPEEPTAFAAAITRLMDDPAERERLGRRARVVAETEMRWERVCDRAEACYRVTRERFG